MKTIAADATSTAPPSAVWALLADHRTWTDWGTWKSVTVEGGDEQGPGVIRVVHRPPFRVRERITEWVPGERMGYEVVDGIKVRGYSATVTLEPTADGGTVVRWRSRYEHAGPIVSLILKAAVNDVCKRVAKAASARQ